jgi:hypothetical protein
MSNYGNVPDEDVDAVTNAVQAAGRIAEGLPPAAPYAWREIANDLALDGILRDWVNNGTNDLGPDDEEDLANLLRLAADLALQQPGERQEHVFRIVGKNVMQDWVDNWNSDDEDDEDEDEF